MKDGDSVGVKALDEGGARGFEAWLVIPRTVFGDGVFERFANSGFFYFELGKRSCRIVFGVGEGHVDDRFDSKSHG